MKPAPRTHYANRDTGYILRNASGQLKRTSERNKRGLCIHWVLTDWAGTGKPCERCQALDMEEVIDDPDERQRSLFEAR